MTIKSPTYCANPYQPSRLLTREVKVGNLGIGGHNPVRLQSMTSTPTSDTTATVNQIECIIKAGGELVRMAVANKKEAENLGNIKKILMEKGYDTPLIADTHFNPDIAIRAAKFVEKVRINPGNYLISRRKYFSTQEYHDELKETEENLIPLIEKCKMHKTALRIGSNHGSLSGRIIYKYGDTPEGMVQSAMEFVNICIDHNFYDIILSMKSSNTRVMVQAYRLLVHEMLKKGVIFPLHIGVTEAGGGEDGRIKSSVGIGSLLLEGLGDTIRVSLTEEPANEIPVAKEIRELMPTTFKAKPDHVEKLPFDPFDYHHRKSHNNPIAGKDIPPVILGNNASNADYLLKKEKIYYLSGKETDVSAVRIKDFEAEQLTSNNNYSSDSLLILEFTSVENTRKAFRTLDKNHIQIPVILYFHSGILNVPSFLYSASAYAGLFLIDGLPDGLYFEHPEMKESHLDELSRNILQASRARIFKTEFISCPGCGRTLFDLQKTTEQIKRSLSHLKGLKIAIMGCIVNGPGEMADADYGYVGAAKGKITLYKNKEIVKQNIPEDKALDELIKLIKENGDWRSADSP